MIAPPVTTTPTPTGVPHLWIGWRIEPEDENFVKMFIKAFEHGKHIQLPIGLPPMGGILTPTPGAPMTLLPPLLGGGSNQQGVTIKLP